MNFYLILLASISLVFSQVAKYETSSIKSNIDKYLNSQISDVKLNTPLDYNSVIVDDKIFNESLVVLDEKLTVRLSLNHIELPLESKFFLIDLEDDDVIGPFYSSNSDIKIGPINSSKFIIQCVIPSNDQNVEYQISIDSIEDMSLLKVGVDKDYYRKRESNRENPIIVVTGFWPPTNEMIRHFSQDSNLNPDGWEGENWQNLGYDIISFFPEFSNPDCSSCGQGYGNFEVDYQDTSDDFWDIIDDINPTSIITFSKGYIDNSWELEYNYYNRTNWYADYLSPFYPTPNPPDEAEVSYFLRNSNLPMENIMDAINESDLGLNSYIDWNGDPGRFVSEFMGYHGVWYRDLYQYDNNNPCYLGGHVHVGGLIDWDTAREAAEITILKTIETLGEYVYLPGDVNSDDQVDILDIVLTISHILGESILTGVSFYAADMNSDGIINIQDVIVVVGLIV